tara:strand:- start:1175 stop:1600 length:426 start_codon:yes stop_codon:yes gene_type:complete
MSIRTLLLTQMANTLAGGGVVSEDYSLEANELPWTASGEPLYVKNMRVVYISDEDEAKVQLYRTLDQGAVYQTETVVQAFLTEDAKNIKANNPTVIENMLNAKSVVNTANGYNVQIAESGYEQEIEDDTITYTFEYTFTTI